MAIAATIKANEDEDDEAEHLGSLACHRPARLANTLNGEQTNHRAATDVGVGVRLTDPPLSDASPPDA